MKTEVKEMQNNSSVKNYQDIQTIKTMYEKAFDDKSTEEIKISVLSGGMKNAVYLIENNNNNNVNAFLYITIWFYLLKL